MSVGGNSYVRRLVRRVWPGRNPLRRRTDWFETWAFLTVLVVAGVSMLLAISTSQGVLRDELAKVQREQASRHEVTATVISRVEDRGSSEPAVVVRWGEPQHESFGVARTSASVRPADTIPVWVNHENRLVPQPTTPSAANQTASVAGASVLLGSTLVTAACYGAARWWVTRRRLAAWGAEWEWVGPQWRRRTG